MAFFVMPFGDDSLTDEEFTGYVLQAMNSPASWYEGVKEEEKGADAKSYPENVNVVEETAINTSEPERKKNSTGLVSDTNIDQLTTTKI